MKKILISSVLTLCMLVSFTGTAFGAPANDLSRPALPAGGWEKLMVVAADTAVLSGSFESVLSAIQGGYEMKVVIVNKEYNSVRMIPCAATKAGPTESGQRYFECNGYPRVAVNELENYTFHYVFEDNEPNWLEYFYSIFTGGNGYTNTAILNNANVFTIYGKKNAANPVFTITGSSINSGNYSTVVKSMKAGNNFKIVSKYVGAHAGYGQSESFDCTFMVTGSDHEGNPGFFCYGPIADSDSGTYMNDSSFSYYDLPGVVDKTKYTFHSFDGNSIDEIQSEVGTYSREFKLYTVN